MSVSVCARASWGGGVGMGSAHHCAFVSWRLWGVERKGASRGLLAAALGFGRVQGNVIGA